MSWEHYKWVKQVLHRQLSPIIIIDKTYKKFKFIQINHTKHQFNHTLLHGTSKDYHLSIGNQNSRLWCFFCKCYRFFGHTVNETVLQNPTVFLIPKFSYMWLSYVKIKHGCLYLVGHFWPYLSLFCLNLITFCVEQYETIIYGLVTRNTRYDAYLPITLSWVAYGSGATNSTKSRQTKRTFWAYFYIASLRGLTPLMYIDGYIKKGRIWRVLGNAAKFRSPQIWDSLAITFLVATLWWLMVIVPSKYHQ